MSAWQESVQEDIAQCMRNEGFVYHAHVTAESSLDLKRVELTPSEFRELHGYGIAQSLFDRVASQAVDPNLAVLSSMDANEVQAYQSALLGDAAGIVVEFVEEIPPLENQGCAGAAIIGNGGAAVSEDLNDFEAALSQGYTRLQNEPEMLFAVEMWQECLAGSGYEFSNREAIQRYLSSELEGLITRINIELKTLEPSSARAAIERGGDDIESLPGYDRAKHHELIKYEIEVAQVDHECYSLHIESIFEPLLKSLEAELIGEYGDALRAARDALGS